MTTDPNRSVEDMIVSLASDAAPVRPLAPVFSRALVWAAIAGVWAALMIGAIGMRAGGTQLLHNDTVRIMFAVGVVSSLLLAVSALRLAVPGLGRFAGWDSVPVFVAVGWAAAVAVLGASGLSHEPWHFACGERVLMFSSVPAFALYAMLRRGYALNIPVAAGVATLAAGALAVAVSSLVCPIDRASHLAVAHMLPMLALGAIGFLPGRRRS